MLTTTRFTFGCLLVSVLALALAPAANAQSANDGSVLGVVTDTTGAAVPDVSVSLRNPQKGNTLSATTDAAGNYEFQVVPAGEYELTASKSGFKQNVRSAFAVHASEHVRVDEIQAGRGARNDLSSVSGLPTIQKSGSSLFSGRKNLEPGFKSW